nr:fasciclin domain-containing protein [Anaerolineae bacterium]
FTVFAPTNDAFAAVPADVLEALRADPALLTRVLTYHVLGEVKTGAELVEEASAVTMEMEAVGAEGTGSELVITVTEDGSVMVNNAMVLVADLNASNGIIHIIDTVLVPADVLAALAAEE